LDLDAPARLEPELVVERRDREAVGRCDVEGLRNLAQRVRRKPAAMLFLCEPEGRHDRRAPLGIELAELLDAVVERRAHLSASPITGSSEPAAAIRSAISCSCTTVAVACSAAKLGARNFTRHGRGPPSETR